MILAKPANAWGQFWTVPADASKADALAKTLRIGRWSFLREWSLARVWEEWRTAIVAGVILVLALLLHGVRTEALVRRRTGELRAETEERLAAERDAREKAARIESLERQASIGQISAVFAHEMNVPLGALLSSVRGVRIELDEAAGLPEEPLREAVLGLDGRLETMERDIRRASAIVGRVREYARNRPARRVPADLDDIARRSLPEFAARRRAGAALRITPDAPRTLPVLCDPLEAELALINLLRNALDATARLPEPRVAVRTGVAPADDPAAPGALEAFVEVADNGGEVTQELLAAMRGGLARTTKPDALQSDEGQTFPRDAIVRSRSGREILSAELDMLTRLRVPVRCLARLEALIPSSGGGRIEGVLVREGGVPDVPDSGAPRRIRARRGVILATGGFGADAAFLRRVAPDLPPGIPTDNHPGATAEALEAAMRAGAAARDLGEVQALPWISADEIGIGSAWSFIEHVTTRHGIWVTDRGVRFVDESASQAVRSKAVMRVLAEGGRVLALVDGSGFAQPGNVGAPVGDWEDLVRRGVIRRSATLAEAARRARIPREAVPRLEESVVRWNAVVRGEAADPFGRVPEKGAMALSDAPWHVVGICPKVHHTMGGLVIDASARVLRTDGSVLAGLFAAGESTGGTFGRNRAPCHSSTDALVTGRIAGREAARRS